MKLICLGDSLTFGYGVRVSQRWTHLCAQDTGWKIVNEGVSGDTTGGMLARLAARVLPELRSDSADEPFQRILLMGGTNDVFYSGSDVSARANMGAMIHQLLSAGVLPLVGIPLPVDDRHAPGEWASVVDFPGAEAVMREYRLWLRRFCAAFGVPCVDFHADFVRPDGTPRSELLLDGLHPTPEGHQLMARRLERQFHAE